MKKHSFLLCMALFFVGAVEGRPAENHTGKEKALTKKKQHGAALPSAALPKKSPAKKKRLPQGKAAALHKPAATNLPKTPSPTTMGWKDLGRILFNITQKSPVYYYGFTLASIGAAASSAITGSPFLGATSLALLIPPLTALGSAFPAAYATRKAINAFLKNPKAAPLKLQHINALTWEDINGASLSHLERLSRPLLDALCQKVQHMISHTNKPKKYAYVMYAIEVRQYIDDFLTGRIKDLDPCIHAFREVDAERIRPETVQSHILTTDIPKLHYQPLKKLLQTSKLSPEQVGAITDMQAYFLTEKDVPTSLRRYLSPEATDMLKNKKIDIQE